LVAVLGHTSCGAVGAALSGESQPGCIGTVIEAIAPSVDAVRGSDEPYRDAIIDHVRRTVERLSARGPIISPAAESGDLLVIGAVYDLASGMVRTL